MNRLFHHSPRNRGIQTIPGTAALCGLLASSACGGQQQHDDVGNLSGGSGGSGPSTDAEGTGGTGTGEGTAAGDADGEDRLDVGTFETQGDPGGGGDCPGGMGGGDEIDFSNIWIANSPEGTVSKIDTMTAVEIGRYQVTPEPTDDPSMGPSRTSVSLNGDMVVIDRDGGLTKVHAREADCPDRNANGMVDTSHDENFLPWGEDECVAWRLELPREDRGNRGPRTVQWTAPAAVDDCTLAEPEQVWAVFCNEGDDDATAWLVDGATGFVQREIPIQDYQCEVYGAYGGAVDANNDLWFVDRDSKRSLFRIDYDCTPSAADPCWEEFERPDDEMDPYGITVAQDGKVWMAGSGNSLYNYDPATDAWRDLKPELEAFLAGKSPPEAAPDNILRGLMMDEEQRLWVATIQNWDEGSPTPGVLEVDTAVDPPTFAYHGRTVFGDDIEHAAGISIDVEGYVWLVDTLGQQAFKIDPDDTGNYVRVQGLVLPYTYSDMTGYGLKGVARPPGVG